ncbi:uncharacterized protein LOC116262685 [Nymphaea colorata]|nr:uncharacterized protein LOC116262685 [Nymphaea colorata]
MAEDERTELNDINTLARHSLQNRRERPPVCPIKSVRRSRADGAHPLYLSGPLRAAFLSQRPSPGRQKCLFLPSIYQTPWWFVSLPSPSSPSPTRGSPLLFRRTSPGFPSLRFPPVDLIVSERDEEEETSVSPSGSVPPGGDAFFIKIEKSGRNRRRVRARVRIATSLEAVWDVLTDYERLIDFIPGLAVCRLIERSGGFVRMFQIGQQSLAFGFKFNAKGTMDCYENDLELLPFGRRRNIDFTMIEGDFQLFRGTWSMVQAEESHSSSFPRTTFLSYIVDVEPKLWLPVSLVEKRLCNEIELNLLSIREEAQKRSATDALSDLS